ncbi:MAG TPA: PepSY domain-containing protein [Hyphomonadaceae bacterium]
MKARVVRFAFALHRWMGVILGLLMLMWCLSGIVMIWAPYPSTTLGSRDFRIEGLAPIALPERVVLPEVPEAATLSSARVEMLGDRPVIALAWQGEQGGRGLFDLSTARKIENIGEAEALKVAQVYVARHGIEGAPSVKRLAERDEFTVAGYFNSGRPYYEVRLNDADETMLYVASTTGEVRQRTTGSLRLTSWLGAIPHWLYFAELRKDAALWGQVIIWTSLAGCFLTVLGLFVGIRQFRRRHSTNRLASPYRGAKFWHHMTGLVFGVLVLTFTFSGFASMQPWGWLESGPRVGEAVDRLAGKPSTWADVRPALEAQLGTLRAASIETVQLSYSQKDGGPFFIRRLADGSRQRLAASGQPAPFDAAAQHRAASLLAGEGATPVIDLMTRADTFYYPGAAASDFPVVRITVPEMEDTRFYLDPVTGDVRFVADPGARGFRWWHMALHTFDVIGSPIREIVILLAMLGVTAVCAFGAWIGIRKLARGGKLDNLPEN